MIVSDWIFNHLKRTLKSNIFRKPEDPKKLKGGGGGGGGGGGEMGTILQL